MLLCTVFKKPYTHYSGRMSPENTHKLMVVYMVGLQCSRQHFLAEGHVLTEVSSSTKRTCACGTHAYALVQRSYQQFTLVSQPHCGFSKSNPKV